MANISTTHTTKRLSFINRKDYCTKYCNTSDILNIVLKNIILATMHWFVCMFQFIDWRSTGTYRDFRSTLHFNTNRIFKKLDFKKKSLPTYSYFLKELQPEPHIFFFYLALN
jgi:hypothetical protein